MTSFAAHLLASALILFGVLLVASLLLLKPITLTVTPRLAVAPVKKVTIRVIVPPHPDNRKLRIEVSGEAFVSELDLEGADADPVFVREWLRPEAGEYQVAAAVYGIHGLRGLERTTVTIKE